MFPEFNSKHPLPAQGLFRRHGGTKEKARVISGFAGSVSETKATTPKRIDTVCDNLRMSSGYPAMSSESPAASSGSPVVSSESIVMSSGSSSTTSETIDVSSEWIEMLSANTGMSSGNPYVS